MASISLSATHTLPHLLQAQTTKSTLSKNLPLLSKSSNSQFHAIRLRNSSHTSVQSYPYVKGSIVAKASAFRDSYEKFKKAGAQVVGISGDGSESHKAFAQKYKLPFTLLSDEGNKVRKEWIVVDKFVDLSTTINSNLRSISLRP